MPDHNLFTAFFSSDSGRDPLEKARIASRLAKMANGQNKHWFYDQKATMLCDDIETHPDEFVLSYFDEHGIIGVRHTPTGERLHLPIPDLTPGARAVLIARLSRALA